jgi:hypothetical protein
MKGKRKKEVAHLLNKTKVVCNKVKMMILEQLMKTGMYIEE